MADRNDAYAAALFAVAVAEESLDRVEEELFRVARTIEGNDELRSTLTDEAVPVDRRQGIIEDLLEDRAHHVTTSLVSFLVGIGRGRQLAAIIDKFVERAAQERSEVVAEVRTAVPLDDDLRTRLGAALSNATGKQVSVKAVVDESVLGGVVAQVGDTIFDGTVRHRLNQLREAL
ncbi:MAG: ATP synthase F1 subunit delta [Actinomycetota bacterium]|nr:ATP synthase F1 subunit delta [Actinomycetota bacterium]